MVGGRGGGVKSVDQALQLREHMALRNVIRLEDHMIWGQTADVLAHDERERARPTIKWSAPSTRTWSGRNRGEREIMTDVNEWCRSSAGSEERLGSSSSRCKIEWDVDRMVPTSARFVPTRRPRYRANFNLRRRREAESGVINHPRQGGTRWRRKGGRPSQDGRKCRRS
jgi:hypothetical protein